MWEKLVVWLQYDTLVENLVHSYVFVTHITKSSTDDNLTEVYKQLSPKLKNTHTGSHHCSQSRRSILPESQTVWSGQQSKPSAAFLVRTIKPTSLNMCIT